MELFYTDKKRKSGANFLSSRFETAGGRNMVHLFSDERIGQKKPFV